MMRAEQTPTAPGQRSKERNTEQGYGWAGGQGTWVQNDLAHGDRLVLSALFVTLVALVTTTITTVLTAINLLDSGGLKVSDRCSEPSGQTRKEI